MPRAKDIPVETKVALALFLTERSAAGDKASIAVNAAAERFSICLRRVWHAWKSRDDIKVLLRPPRSSYRTRATKRSKKEVATLVAGVPLVERQTLASLAKATGIPKTSLSRYMRSGWLRRTVSRVKPTLTDTHKIRRLLYCLAHVERPIGNLCRIKNMYDVVHIDEKWFNLYKGVTRYYLTPDEGLPYKATPNKRYIGKQDHATMQKPKGSSTGKLAVGQLLKEFQLKKRKKTA
ncbi:Hypothetical protein PHPALM_13209 [Phytophthora palmivora]|uniref:Transposase Tc1-like domain-containing protein n=1 Tax=Phytophthora palmivora TaxID=4796 RepID=A0A2P4XXT6_9STRA|nr:Hypothetical protein PHPALM_13209 [Phytophthora palmivora]